MWAALPQAGPVEGTEFLGIGGCFFHVPSNKRLWALWQFSVAWQIQVWSWLIWSGLPLYVVTHVKMESGQAERGRLEVQGRGADLEF